MKTPPPKNLAFCNYCQAPRRVVWVHGHGQCEICKINIDECCRGAALDDNDPGEDSQDGG